MQRMSRKVQFFQRSRPFKIGDVGWLNSTKGYVLFIKKYNLNLNLNYIFYYLIK